MKNLFFAASALPLLLSTGLTAHAQDDDTHPALQDVIIVTGQRLQTQTEIAMHPDLTPMEGPDVTLTAARTPGAARIGNGGLSGQLAYRGLFGARLNLRVDGQRFASAGPNLMDPVFHYAPSPLVSAVVMDRGVSPVSAGPGLAGGGDAVFKTVDFSDSAAASLGYDVTLGARSIDESYMAGGVVGASTDTWRFNALGAYEKGSDTEYKNGTISGSAFERAVYGLSAGAKLGPATEFAVDVRRQETGDSGNPPFPMDIRYFDADFAKARLSHAIGENTFTAKMHYSSVAHAMNNYDQRPNANMMMFREALAQAETQGAAIEWDTSFAGGDVKLGIDYEAVDHNVYIINPNNVNFLVENLPDIEETRTGVFAEWQGGLGIFEGELGVRVDDHTADAGVANLGSALPMGPQMLATAFNNLDKDIDETTADVVARLWTPEENGLSWRLTLARKTHMPNYLQRYGWMPLNASGGLADGNIYIGDIKLEPEVALIAEAGFDYRNDIGYLRPTVYVRQIDDYIQGVPYDDTIGVADSLVEMVATMGGDPTPLRFANVDARLYGFDLDGGVDFNGPLRLDGVVSYVRGERRDIDDDLYRVSAPRLMTGLTWEGASWASTLEMVAVAEQSQISVSNSETPSPGYVVLNFNGHWDVSDGVSVSAGIENLLDQSYADHLSGRNRNAASDVPLGERVPGAGRGVFLRLHLRG